MRDSGRDPLELTENGSAVLTAEVEGTFVFYHMSQALVCADLQFSSWLGECPV